MKVSHLCPNCKAYNNVADGVALDPPDLDLGFTCTACGTRWSRQICESCRGTCYFLDQPCDCDGGMVPINHIEFVTKQGGVHVGPTDKPKFGEKPKPRTDFEL